MYGGHEEGRVLHPYLLSAGSKKNMEPNGEIAMPKGNDPCFIAPKMLLPLHLHT